MLVLGSALSGCSWAGFGGLGGGDFGQQGQHWASNSYCVEQLDTAPVNTSVNTNACQSAYPAAQSNVATQPYGGQAVASQYSAQKVAPSPYAAAPYAAAQTVAPAYGAQLPAAQPYASQPYVAPTVAAGQYPAYQGQQGFQTGGFAPAFVGPQSRGSNGLRQAYTLAHLAGFFMIPTVTFTVSKAASGGSQRASTAQKSKDHLVLVMIMTAS